MSDYPRALTIAGSDSGGGAGIQGDLKTFTVIGVYGAAAITALTAQNTQGVMGIHAVPFEFVRLQIDAVLSDIGADAVKTGMLANAGIVKAVAEGCSAHGVRNLVVDPVMVSKHGALLLEREAVNVLIERLLPLAAVVTPNAPEAALLAGMKVETFDDMWAAAGRILALGCRSVLLKGGHLADEKEAVDYWTDGAQELRLSAPRRAAIHTHGTGCALSAALTAHLAMGQPLPDAVRAAKDFVTRAIAASRPLGGGIGPVNHLWAIRRRAP